MIKYLRRPFHIPDYKVTSDCPNFFESLYLQYGGYVSDTDCENPYCITVTKEPNGRYMLEHIGGKSITGSPLRELDDILFNTTSYDESIIPLHGAATEYDGYAYIFLAPTTSGKTTLTAYLTYNGFRYITEDCILIDKRALGVYQYECPVHLRSGGVEVLKRNGITISGIKPLDDHAGTRYVYTPNNCVRTSISLGGIFFILRSETENRVINMTVSESIAELMKSGMTVYRPSSEHIRLMANLARTGCKRIIYRDMEYVKNIITKGNQYGETVAD